MQRSHVDRTRRAAAGLAALAAAVVTCLSSAAACDTPVYRFAMYNWPDRAVYQVYCLAHGQPDEADRAAHDALDQLATDPSLPANVELILVDVDDETEFNSLPDEVRQAWQARDDQPGPPHLVFSPLGALLSTERLDADEIRSLVESPARTQMAELLQQGHSGVLIVLTGNDDEANAAVEEAVTQTIEDGRNGLIRPFTLFPVVNEDTPDESTVLDVGRITVRRDDPRERWLVRMLLGVEPDLAELEHPMVFPAYGRGRVMEPYVGPGVTVNNLTEAVAFIAGACSCEIQEQNPGVELLTRWDWQSAARAVAERYGAEEGNEHLLGEGDVLPSILLTVDDAAPDSRSAVVETPADDKPRPTNQATSRPLDSGQSTAATPSSGSFATTLSRNLAVVAAVACVGLVLVGFFLMRPRH